MIMINTIIATILLFPVLIHCSLNDTHRDINSDHKTTQLKTTTINKTFKLNELNEQKQTEKKNPTNELSHRRNYLRHSKIAIHRNSTFTFHDFYNFVFGNQGNSGLTPFVVPPPKLSHFSLHRKEAQLKNRQLSNSCIWAHDGVCDVPRYCSYGTDDSDCKTTASPATSPATDYCNNNHHGNTNPCASDRSDFCCDRDCTYCGPSDYCERYSPFRTHSGTCNPSYSGGVCKNYFSVCTNSDSGGAETNGAAASGSTYSCRQDYGCPWDTFTENHHWGYVLNSYGAKTTTYDACKNWCDGQSSCSGFEYSVSPNYCSYWKTNSCSTSHSTYKYVSNFNGKTCFKLSNSNSNSKKSAGSSCSSNNDCTSGTCRGDNCCGTKGQSTGCTACNSNGDCASCSSDFYLSSGVCLSKKVDGSSCSDRSNNNLICNSISLQALQHDDLNCPHDPDIDNCESSSLQIGDLCEGDGECNTNSDLDNCDDYDIYRVLDFAISNQCSSGTCSGGKCCNDNGKSAGCTECDSNGDCKMCSTSYYKSALRCHIKKSDGGICSTNNQCSSNICSGTNCCKTNVQSSGCTECDSHGDCKTTNTGDTAVAVAVFDVTSGSCKINTDDNCLVSSNYPNNYDSSDYCGIEMIQSGKLNVEAFNTESSHDTLSVRSKKYSGNTNGPNGVVVQSGDMLYWKSDSSVTRSGFKICLTVGEFDLNDNYDGKDGYGTIDDEDGGYDDGGFDDDDNDGYDEDEDSNMGFFWFFMFCVFVCLLLSLAAHWSKGSSVTSSTDGTPSRKDRLSKGQSKTLYHQTSRNVAKKIINSQRMIRGSNGIVGGGIYFAVSPADTDRKAHNNGVTLKCRVRLGKIKKIETSTQSDSDITHTNLLSSGYDSVLVTYTSGNEHVVYNWDQVHTIRFHCCNDSGGRIVRDI